METLLISQMLVGFLAGEAMEEAPGEVEHVHGPIDLRIHVLDADEAADGDNGPVAAEAVTSGLFLHPDMCPFES